MFNQSLNTTPTILTPKSSTFQQNLANKKFEKKYKRSVLWGSVNAIFLAIVVCDIILTCPLYYGYVQYAKYAVTCFLIINLLYHFCQILRYGSPAQNKTGQSTESSVPSERQTVNMQTNSFCVDNSFRSSFIGTPTLDNISNISQNRSRTNLSPSRLAFSPTTEQNLITDQASLDSYLSEFDMKERSFNTSNTIDEGANYLNSFWNYPATKSLIDLCPFKRNQYQLSSHSPARSSSGSPKSDDKGSPVQLQDTWRSLNVNSMALTQWNANLRMWISQTIFDRLIKEITSIDKNLQTHGFHDVSIGNVGLDRLCKMAQLAHVRQSIPTLAAVIPFLEMCPNQQYLVKRVRELSKGGCMSDYRWNGGSGAGINKEWDDSLPSDAEIVMHLFATYMDTQLLPQPSNPDLKPFTNFHFIKDKMPTLTPSTLAIQQVTKNPPHYRVVIGETVYEMIKGYNNLFHSMLLFLYHVHKKEHGMLGRVNLGKSGVNMLWVINRD